MTVLQVVPRALPTTDPQPVSPETLALVDQVLQDVVHGLRERLLAPSTQEAANIEYESWLRGARH